MNKIYVSSKVGNHTVTAKSCCYRYCSVRYIPTPDYYICIYNTLQQAYSTPARHASTQAIRKETAT